MLPKAKIEFLAIVLHRIYDSLHGVSWKTGFKIWINLKKFKKFPKRHKNQFLLQQIGKNQNFQKQLEIFQRPRKKSKFFKKSKTLSTLPLS